MFKKVITPLSESMADIIAKTINRHEYIEEKAVRGADRAEGDVKPTDISGEEEVKADASAKKAPARKGDQAKADSMEKVKEEVEELDENKAIIKLYQDMKAQGKKDHNILDYIGSMPKYKKVSRDQMAKMIGDAKRKGIFKEEVELTEAKVSKDIALKVLSMMKNQKFVKVSNDFVPSIYLSGSDKDALKKEFGKLPRGLPSQTTGVPVVTLINYALGVNNEIDTEGGETNSPKLYDHRKGKVIGSPKTVGDAAKLAGLRLESIQEDNTNDKSDDGEGLDKVQPKAVKKKFTDRKDKDIDNDGDTDSSDEYLHKRRKAISKALESKKPNASVDESAELEGLDEAKDTHKTKDGRTAKKGLWYNINKKKERGEKPLPKGHEDRPSEQDFENARKTTKEEVVSEAKDDYTINHKTFSSAVQHALEMVKKRGFEVDDDEWDRKVAMGPRKPGKGKTNRYTIALTKGGKPTRKNLQMQVYYDEGRYELNMYIS